MSRLVCLGLGYSARVFARRMQEKGWAVTGTTRGKDNARRLRAEGFSAIVFDGQSPSNPLRSAIAEATHVLASIAPGEDGDPALIHHANDLRGSRDLEWIAYLSTVGVYGDHNGAWVDETTPLKPKSKRSIQRVAAEREWLEFGARTGKAVHVFRLAGIYGPGRGPLENVRAGKARRIIKAGQVFNRIHVEDIANVLEASLARPRPGAIYNLTDDEPAPPQDVVAHACELLGLDVPEGVPFEKADLTPMGRSFYGENKRVSNRLIKSELKVKLMYPTYREGMATLLAH